MNPNNDTSETNPTENKTAFVEAATQIKLPQFWTCSPAAWFFQAEAQFNLKRITSDVSRYEHVITALPQDIVILVVDILQKPPTENKYETLKKSLLERTVDSEEKRLAQILSNNNELGDRKPSEFYRHLEILAGNSAMVGKELLQNLWMRKLPININVALLASGKQDITELCAIADKIWNVTHTSYISTVSDVSSSNLSSAENYLARLESKIDALEKKFTRTNIRKDDINDRQYKRERSKSPRRNSTRSQFKENGKFCWYHFTFGKYAQKCIKPCEFKNLQGNSLN